MFGGVGLKETIINHNHQSQSSIIAIINRNHQSSQSSVTIINHRNHPSQSQSSITIINHNHQSQSSIAINPSITIINRNQSINHNHNHQSQSSITNINHNHQSQISITIIRHVTIIIFFSSEESIQTPMSRIEPLPCRHALHRRVYHYTNHVATASTIPHVQNIYIYTYLYCKLVLEKNKYKKRRKLFVPRQDSNPVPQASQPTMLPLEL